MIENSIAIIVPGVGNTDQGFRQFFSRLDQEWPIKVAVFNALWTEGEEVFEDKLTHLIQVAKLWRERSTNLFLLGMSASASLVLSAMHELGDDVNAAVTICGRLKDGDNSDEFPQQAAVLQKYPAHQRAVQAFEYRVHPCMTDDELHKVLTIQPWRDEIVPVDTMSLPGAINIAIPSFGHGRSLYSAQASSLALGFMLGKR